MLNRLLCLTAIVPVLSACSSAPTPNGALAPVRVLATFASYAEEQPELLSLQNLQGESGLSQQAAGDYQAIKLFVSEVVLIHAGAPRTLERFEEPLELELLGLRDLRIEIADAELPSGTYEDAQLRLVLSGAELVVEDEDGESMTHVLETPSAEQSGYKLQLGDLEVDPVEGAILLLDFNPYSSIVETGNGRYLLKPVLTVSQLFP